MTKDKIIQYKKAYVELNEIFNILDEKQKDKIPECLVENIRKNMDMDYNFRYDMDKNFFEQDLMVETEALLVEIYERYLAPEEEKQMWYKYDKFCLNQIEERKREKYNNNVFEKNKLNPKITENIENKSNENAMEYNSNNCCMVTVHSKKFDFFRKIIIFIKGILGKKDK